MPFVRNLRPPEREWVSKDYADSLVAKLAHAKISLENLKKTEESICTIFRKMPPSNLNFPIEVNRHYSLFLFYSDALILNVATCLDIIAILCQLKFNYCSLGFHRIDFKKLVEACNGRNSNIPSVVETIIVENNNEWVGHDRRNENKNMLSQLRNHIAHHSILATSIGGTIAGEGCRTRDNLFFICPRFYIVDDPITLSNSREFTYLPAGSNPIFLSEYFDTIVSKVREFIITIIPEVLSERFSEMILPRC